MDLNKFALKVRQKEPYDENKFVRAVFEYSKTLVQKYSQKYSLHNEEDIDTILTNLYLRIKKNFNRWDPERCKFTTWLYSCTIIEVKHYYQTIQPHYKRFHSNENVNYHITSTTKPEEKIVVNIVNLDAILLWENIIGKEKEWNVIYDGKIVAHDSDIAELSDWIVWMQELGELNGQMYYQLKIPREKAKPYEVEFKHEDEVYDYTLSKKREILQDAIKLSIDTKYHDILNDYFSGDFKYTDLMQKYDKNMQTVKNILHLNKKKLRQTIKETSIFEK